MPADITVEAEHARLVDAAVAQFGRLDGAFNNAGVLGRRPLPPLPGTADFAEVMLANVQAMFWAMKAQIPGVARPGRRGDCQHGVGGGAGGVCQ